MNARRVALDELWHPAAATALERALHPAGHGPNSSSLHSLFCRYATSSPGRGKSLAAGRSRRRCNISGKIIFIICSSETTAVVSELLFHGRGRSGEQQVAAKPSQAPSVPAPPKGELLCIYRSGHTHRKSRNFTVPTYKAPPLGGAGIAKQ